MNNRHGLGRGLGALLSRSPESAGPVTDIPIDSITANPQQPRKAFEDKAVRRMNSGYQLIVGERRWRAAKLAGLSQIPAVVREATDAQSLELALVENLLREDLNPMEEAEAYHRLLAEFGWTQEELAQRVGRDRSTIANCLRLLKLPEVIQADLRAGRLSMGHARALLSLTAPIDQLRLRAEILAHSWSVRATEEGVKRGRSKSSDRPTRHSPEMGALEDMLRSALATRVRVVGTERAGRIEIAYSSREELDRVVELVTGARA